MISRNRSQISPRFFDFPEPGGVDCGSPGGRGSGSDSAGLVVVLIQTAYQNGADYLIMTDSSAPSSCREL
jgi:hypothetical protein